MESGNEEGSNPFLVSSQEQNLTAFDLNVRLRSLRNCYTLMRKHGASLQDAISDMESYQEKSEEDMRQYLRMLNEKAMLFGIASHAMMHSSNRYLRSVEYESNRTVKVFNFERARNRRLETIIRDVAKQHAELERQSKRVSEYISFSHIDEMRIFSDEFSDEDSKVSDIEKEEADFDENELVEVDSLAAIRRSVLLQPRRSSFDHRTRFADLIAETVMTNELPMGKPMTRRTRVPDRPNISFNSWAIMKNNIGKDLSKIAMPVNFNEPLSMLQRLTEELEYSELLDIAAGIEDISKQMAYVAAFSVSTYSSTGDRLGKPFNPLLGETYECDRTQDFGWRSIAEQVSHHPPISAVYAEGRGWTCWQEFSMKTKFRGKNLQVIPSGHVYCHFPKTGNKYKWGKAMTIVNNVIVGKMWIDQQGDIEILGLDAAIGASCTVSFIPYSLFSREQQRRVKGIVRSSKEGAKWLIQGYWNSQIEIAPVLTTINTGSQETYELGQFNLIWTRLTPNPECEKYYNMPEFACQLNEPEEGVAPTDSRMRSDLRLMEQGLWDESNCEKLRLEEKQRAKHRPSEPDDTTKSSSLIATHTPIWFERILENDKVIHVYQGMYWNAKQKQDWSLCPDIFK